MLPELIPVHVCVMNWWLLTAPPVHDRYTLPGSDAK